MGQLPLTALSLSSKMNYHGTSTLLLLLISVNLCLNAPVDTVKNVDKRTMDGTPPLNPFLTPYAMYPGMGIGMGMKPFSPFLPPDFFLNKFATPGPALTPMGLFFKTKKDEFLNKLFDQISVPGDTTLDKEARSVLEAADYDDEVDSTTDAATTSKPKVDTAAFKTKKFDFLSKLFKSLNTTTVSPLDTVVTTDPTATTVKPTIVPPGFWAPVMIPPKPPKPPKPSKAPKPSKTATPEPKSLLDMTVLKAVLAELDPENPLVATDKTAREASFLDAFLHRVTTTPEPALEDTAADTKSEEARSLIYPPGYWIPPYIYAAKMGIYLDKLFDTIESAAETDETTEDLVKRSTETDSSPVDPSTLILGQLTALKNDLLAAFAESTKATPTPSTKAGSKAIKKPFWAIKTTPAPAATPSKIDVLSEVFDKLAEVQQAILTGQDGTSAPTLAATASEAPATVVPPEYWIPDPTAVDFATFYKSKTQDFLAKLFAPPTPSPEDD